MKKMALIFALFTAGVLSCTEPARTVRGNPSLENLPAEIQSIIMTYVLKDLSLKDTVNTIKNMSLINAKLNQIINNRYGNPQAFKSLIYMLADKFEKTPFDIALEFNSAATKKYIQLGSALIDAISQKNDNTVTTLINEGADVNFTLFTGDYDAYTTPLIDAVQFGNAKIVQLLLDAGANPYMPDNINLTALDYAEPAGSTKDKEEIRTLLQKAMNK